MENVQKIIEQTNSKALDVQDKKHLTLYLSRGYYQGNLTNIFNMFEKFGIEVNIPDTSCGNERYLQFVNDDKNAVLLNFFTEPADELLIKYPNVRFFSHCDFQAMRLLQPGLSAAVGGYQGDCAKRGFKVAVIDVF